MFGSTTFNQNLGGWNISDMVITENIQFELFNTISFFEGNESIH